MPEPKLAVVTKTPFKYKPVLSDTERRAYAAAHRILREVTHHGELDLACRGAQRTRMVDKIAAILREEFNDESL